MCVPFPTHVVVSIKSQEGVLMISDSEKIAFTFLASTMFLQLESYMLNISKTHAFVQSSWECLSVEL